ncbi:hypothetical protein EV363DRAFT_1438053 [Boletus edulis]|nr:hypothetical protein EV363DRAFT_1438053 [Boletus edulis]
MHHPTQTLQQEADSHRTLAIERDTLLQDIRRLPGFERFLFPKDFSQLRTSAHSGLIVILNAAERRCDALIILTDVDHVPLPGFDFQRAAGLQNTLRELLGHARITRSDDRKGKLGIPLNKMKFFRRKFHITLGDLPHIFWGLTGLFVFLPIHAAGLYGTLYSSPSYKVLSDFVASSYIPTLSILAKSLTPSIASSGDLHLLFVPQLPSDGQNHLQGVARELEQFKIRPQRYLAWFRDATQPTDGGLCLCLADGRRLKVPDMIRLSRSRGGGSFLSACQTAMGDEDLTDEAIHIAVECWFAGTVAIGRCGRSVTAFAPVVAREVYQCLFRNGTRPDHRDAGRALHEAVGRLRESGEASFLTWLPFIHVGL